MSAEKKSTILTYLGLPLTDDPARDEQLLAFAIRSKRFKNVIRSAKWESDDPPEQRPLRIREEIVKFAKKKGPVGVRAISGSVPLVLESIEGLGPEVVVAFNGIAGPVDPEQASPDVLTHALRGRPRTFISYMERYVGEHILRRITPDVLVRVSMVTGTRDDQVPPKISLLREAAENEVVWTPPMPGSWESPSHVANIVYGLNSKRQKKFFQRGFNAVMV